MYYNFKYVQNKIGRIDFFSNLNHTYKIIWYIFPHNTIFGGQKLKIAYGLKYKNGVDSILKFKSI